jgi:hypothetical protein
LFEPTSDSYPLSISATKRPGKRPNQQQRKNFQARQQRDALLQSQQAMPIQQAMTKPIPQLMAIPIQQAMTMPVQQAMTKPIPQLMAIPIQQAMTKPVQQAMAMPIQQPDEPQTRSDIAIPFLNPVPALHHIQDQSSNFSSPKTQTEMSGRSESDMRSSERRTNSRSPSKQKYPDAKLGSASSSAYKHRYFFQIMSKFNKNCSVNRFCITCTSES